MGAGAQPRGPPRLSGYLLATCYNFFFLNILEVSQVFLHLLKMPQVFSADTCFESDSFDRRTSQRP